MSRPEPRLVRFTKKEAEAKAGRTVRTLDQFYGVPYDSTGKVIGIHEAEPGGFDVVIKWELPNKMTARFGRSTYERYLDEQ